MSQDLIDYLDAAERLLDTLAVIGASAEKPMPAIDLVLYCFDPEIRGRWLDDETRKRRVRDAVIKARELLIQRNQWPVVGGQSPAPTTGHFPSDHSSALVANGRGYWLAVDAGTLAWYAGRRRAAGLRDLAAAGSAKRTAAAVGQTSLFGGPP